jgi:hypothetical protein
MVSSVLFDESHGELLRMSSPDEEDDIDTFGTLQKILTNGWKWKVSSHHSCDGPISQEVLKDHDVFVIASPLQLLDEDECQAVIDFVTSGKSVLLIYDGIALNKYLEESGQFELEDSLLKSLGLRFTPLLSYPPDEISKFTPHYLTSEVELVFFREPSCIQQSESAFDDFSVSSQCVINSSIVGESFLAALEPGDGRVIVLADHSILSDSYIEYGSNKQLTSNIFRWLGVNNYLDISIDQQPEKVLLGDTAGISISLANPHAKRLEYISCLIEGDSNVEIVDAQEKVVRSIAPFGQAHIQWTFKSNCIGHHTFKLTIESLKDRKSTPLFFEKVADFQCVSNFEFDLNISNALNPQCSNLLTGESATVKTILKSKGEKVKDLLGDVSLTSSEGVLIEPRPMIGDDFQWEITPQNPGYHPISLTLNQTGEQVYRLIYVAESIEDQIREIERKILAPLEGEIYRQIKFMKLGLDIDEISEIPFRIMTSEEYIRCIYGEFTQLHDYVHRVLHASRNETCKNKPLVKLLLSLFCPTYSPKYGCCIPYDPSLASYLARSHPEYSDNLAQNFLSLDPNDHIWITQNIAALILHEKYGHGFFFTQTTLGKQMATLFRNGMQRGTNPDFMRTPYPRLTYESYKEVIEQLWDSSDLFMEGFATWVELTVLPHLSPLIAQGRYHRKSFLFSDIDGTYQTGYHFFQTCQDFLKLSGVPHALVSLASKIADVDVGIAEQNSKICFSIPAESLGEAISEQFQLDPRLKQISERLSSLENSSSTQQSVLKCMGKEKSLDKLIESVIKYTI